MTPQVNPSSPVYLTATTSVVQQSTPPVVVVGLPRSGSSFLCHVLSMLKDWYVFDDLYVYQIVQAQNLKGSLTPEQQQKFLDRLGWATRARIKWERNFFVPQCSWDEVFQMEKAILETFQGQAVDWPTLLEEWMMRLALHHDCHHWGYKTPQDFMHMDTLTDLFPGIRFIFILRDPRKVMASMKNLVHRKGGDGDPRQYHPVAYALYWKMAYEKVQQFIAGGRAPVAIVRFEELVANPSAIAESLAEFLETEVANQVAVERSNTSFESQKRRDVTATERWLCEQLVGPTMEKAGYEVQHVKPKFQDVIDLGYTSAQFALYQAHRIITDKKRRKSVLAYLNHLTRLFREKSSVAVGTGQR